MIEAARNGYFDVVRLISNCRLAHRIPDSAPKIPNAAYCAAGQLGDVSLVKEFINSIDQASYLHLQRNDLDPIVKRTKVFRLHTNKELDTGLLEGLSEVERAATVAWRKLMVLQQMMIMAARSGRAGVNWVDHT